MVGVELLGFLRTRIYIGTKIFEDVKNEIEVIF